MLEVRLTNTEVERATYLDLDLIFLLFLFSLLIRFFLHFALILLSSETLAGWSLYSWWLEQRKWRHHRKLIQSSHPIITRRQRPLRLWITMPLAALLWLVAAVYRFFLVRLFDLWLSLHACPAPADGDSGE